MGFDTLIEPLRRSLIQVSRKSLRQTFMRSLAAEVFPPAIKPLLLCSPVRAGRATNLSLHRPVHPLVAAIVLRAAGTAEFYFDSEPNPPHAQLAQASKCTRCKSGALVYPNDLRKPVLLECRAKCALCPILRCLWHYLRTQRYNGCVNPTSLAGHNDLHCRV